jgi:hypothetical protein
MTYYGPDSLAVYSLVSADDARRLLRLVEDAYLVLSDPSSRKAYDRAHGLVAPDVIPSLHEPAAVVSTASVWMGSNPFDDESEPIAAPVVVEPPKPADSPPAQRAQAEPAEAAKPKQIELPLPEAPPPALELAAAPRPESPAEPAAATAQPPVEMVDKPVEPAPEPEPEIPALVEAPHPAPEKPPEPTVVESPPEAIAEPAAHGEPLAEPIEPLPMAIIRAQARQREPTPAAPPTPSATSSKPPSKAFEIPSDAVYNGELLRRVRESRALTARELSERTKITLAHVENIEADHYRALPVTVYLRGFLMSIARELRLDPLKVSKSYLDLVLKAKQKS